MVRGGRALAASGFALAVLCAPAMAVDRDLGGGWHEMTFDGKAPNRWIIVEDENIEVLSEAGVSLLYRRVTVDLLATPCLSWEWRVDAAPPASDLARKGKDDRAIALYVSFPFLAEQATLWELFKRPFVEAVRGADAPGRVISYVWGGVRERGRMVVSPYLGAAGMLKIMRPEPERLGEWVTEIVAVDGDYRTAFDDEAPAPIQIAVSADSDDTASTSHARIRNIAFTRCG